MGKSWQHMKPKQTERKITIIHENHHKEKRTANEYCSLCSSTNCNLYGNYGTWNEFGSFNGICDECLDKCNRLQKGETEIDWMKAENTKIIKMKKSKVKKK